MSRIASRLRELATAGRKALVPYIVAGDPSPEVTVPMMHALVEQGADIIELGIPFSDPMAEGPVIQLAHERALTHHVSLADVLELVSQFRQKNTDTPVVLMGYANPVEHMGYTRFAERAAKAGVDGLLTVDMPPEEAPALSEALKREAIDNIFLLAPTTTTERIKKVASLAGGYLYYVSLKGVTGAGNLNIAEVAEKVEQIKSLTDLPIAVGFGIKDAESAAAVAKVADGVVVGSALVQRVADEAAAGKTGDAMIGAAVPLIGDIRRAI